MSVYTAISQQQLQQFLALYAIQDLVSFVGIKDGIDNTNYRVNTRQKKYVLTIFESLTAQELPSYLQLLSHLNQCGFPAPQPQISQSGSVLNRLQDKPSALFNCLPGLSVDTPLSGQCTTIGRYLATLHLATQHSHFYQKNNKNLQGCQSIFHKISRYLTYEEQTLLQFELDFQLNYVLPDSPQLPQGIIHGDLFRDNVLFEHNQLSGIVDFYNACHDYYLFDIAITINDWCMQGTVINAKKFKALLAGYQQIRQLSPDECHHLKAFLRLAALRFWLSRRHHQLNLKTDKWVLQKDPLVFRHLLEFHQNPQAIDNSLIDYTTTP